VVGAMAGAKAPRRTFAASVVGGRVGAKAPRRTLRESITEIEVTAKRLIDRNPSFWMCV
jgi:hypothetical protein